MLNVKKTHFTFEACGSVIILKTAGSFNWSCMCLTGNVGLCVMKLYLFLAFLLTVQFYLCISQASTNLPQLLPFMETGKFYGEHFCLKRISWNVKDPTGCVCVCDRPSPITVCPWHAYLLKLTQCDIQHPYSSLSRGPFALDSPLHSNNRQ